MILIRLTLPHVTLKLTSGTSRKVDYRMSQSMCQKPCGSERLKASDIPYLETLHQPMAARVQKWCDAGHMHEVRNELQVFDHFCAASLRGKNHHQRMRYSSSSSWGSVFHNRINAFSLFYIYLRFFSFQWY